MPILSITPFRPTGPQLVSQATYTAMLAAVALITHNAPNATTTSAIYQALDAKLVTLGLTDLNSILNQLVTNSIIRYCPVTGTYYLLPSNTALTTIFAPNPNL